MFCDLETQEPYIRPSSPRSAYICKLLVPLPARGPNLQKSPDVRQATFASLVPAPLLRDEDGGNPDVRISERLPLHINTLIHTIESLTANRPPKRPYGLA